MFSLRLLAVCTLAFGLAGCRKKSDTAGREIREAGYAMTAEGWFGAVRGNDVAVMGKMVSAGFDVKTLDAEGRGALHVAAGAGAVQAAEFLLNKGFSVNAKGAKGRTPLMEAVIADRPIMVQWLLKQGADPAAKDEGGFMALMLAVTNGGKSCVGELAPYYREDLDSALLLAALVGKADVIDELTNYGASVYARMEDGRTPLMLAAQNGHKEAAALLIDIGASRFATTESGDTAQSLAVAAGHAELAELIEKGFTGDALALESDEQIAEAMVETTGDFQPDPDEPAEDGGDEVVAGIDAKDAEKKPWNDPLPGQGGGNFGLLPSESTGQKGSVKSLEGATVSNAGKAVKVKLDGYKVSGMTGTARKSEGQASTPVENLPLVMRNYRQRELPVTVKKVSGGVASLHLPGPQPRELEVKEGDAIPGSQLVVVKVFVRTEQGKLNNSQPIEVGVVEVEDKSSGLRGEWLEGRPVTGHDPVALVEDAATGNRYLAKPGQKFSAADGREFIVNDVRPGQLVIEDTASGEVRTLRLRGPRG